MEHVVVLCPCGTSMSLTPKKAERKRYCSNECKYRFRERPSGLTYNIKQVNPSWYQEGHESLRGSGHPAWRGEEVGYRDLHRWVARQKTKRGVCEWCGSEGYTEWANISHEYRRDVDDWAELCRLCHRGHDSGENRGVATQRYGREAVQGVRKS